MLIQKDLIIRQTLSQLAMLMIEIVCRLTYFLIIHFIYFLQKYIVRGNIQNFYS